MIMATLILSAAIGLLLTGQKIMQNMAEQRIRLEIQQATQTVLYRMASDVRNSKSIVTLTDGTLILRSFDTRRLGFDVGIPPAVIPLFNPATEGSITYQFILNPPLSYLRRQEIFGGVVRLDQQLLKNMLVPADAVNYIFTPVPAAATPPYDTVSLVLRLKPSYWKKDPILYETQVQLRTKQ